MNTTIAIDIRKINDTGIGNYIQNIVPRVIQAFPYIRFYLLGKISQLQKFSWTKQPNVVLVNINSGVFSISEQFEVYKKTPSDTTLFWATHFNFPLLYRGKLLVTVYDMILLAVPQSLHGIIKKIYVYGMFFALHFKANNILCISHFTSNELVRIIGIPPNKIKSIHIGVDEKWFHIIKQVRLHLKPYIIFIGNIKPNKNVVRLLQAFNLVLDQIPHDLIIIGKKEGFITGDTNVFIQANKLEGRITFTGYVSNDELQQYVAHADALVFPSLYEGFGLPPLEAMACGCPVVVSNTSSLPEVCGDAALYCDPYSPADIARQIVRILSDQVLREELVRKGKQRASEFTWGKCAQTTICEIEKLLND